MADTLTDVLGVLKLLQKVQINSWTGDKDGSPLGGVDYVHDGGNAGNLLHPFIWLEAKYAEGGEHVLRGEEGVFDHHSKVKEDGSDIAGAHCGVARDGTDVAVFYVLPKTGGETRYTFKGKL